MPTHLFSARHDLATRSYAAACTASFSGVAGVFILMSISVYATSTCCEVKSCSALIRVAWSGAGPGAVGVTSEARWHCRPTPSILTP